MARTEPLVVLSAGTLSWNSGVDHEGLPQTALPGCEALGLTQTAGRGRDEGITPSITVLFEVQKQTRIVLPKVPFIG